MLNLNDLRVFERVASLGGFTAAARVLGLPKSSVSRSVERLEAELGVRLLQRTTRRVALTPAGKELQDRCDAWLAQLRDTLDHVGGLGDRPRGNLRISAGIGFGIEVLSRQLPGFLARYPDVTVSLDLTSKLGNPVDEGVDVAVRMGPLPDSGARSVRLGQLERRLCAARAYLERRGRPQTIGEIAGHDTIEMPRGDGRPRRWTFRRGGEVEHVDLQPRVTVNEAITIFRLVRNGVGLGIVSDFLCRPELETGDLTQLFPEWVVPAIEVHLVFPSGRALAPAIRAFVDYMKAVVPTDDVGLV